MVAVVIGGVVLVLAGVAVFMRATRQKATPVDPIASTTGSNRTLTGTHATGDRSAIHWDEALRRFVAYALDDAPREALSVPPDPEHAPVFQAVAQILERIEARPEYIPRRPSLLPKLLSTVNDPQAAMVEISRIIAQDPALTGNLLRIANSPMYRVSSQPVESIDRAVTLVGVQGIRSIIATALLQPVMTGGSGRLQPVSRTGLGAHAVLGVGCRDARGADRNDPNPSSRSSSACCMDSRPSWCFGSCAISSPRIRS